MANDDLCEVCGEKRSTQTCDECKQSTCDECGHEEIGRTYKARDTWQCVECEFGQIDKAN